MILKRLIQNDYFLGQEVENGAFTLEKGARLQEGLQISVSCDDKFKPSDEAFTCSQDAETKTPTCVADKDDGKSPFLIFVKLSDHHRFYHSLRQEIH